MIKSKVTGNVVTSVDVSKIAVRNQGIAETAAKDGALACRLWISNGREATDKSAGSKAGIRLQLSLVDAEKNELLDFESNEDASFVNKMEQFFCGTRPQGAPRSKINYQHAGVHTRAVVDGKPYEMQIPLYEDAGEGLKLMGNIVITFEAKAAKTSLGENIPVTSGFGDNLASYFKRIEEEQDAEAERLEQELKQKQSTEVVDPDSAKSTVEYGA